MEVSIGICQFNHDLAFKFNFINAPERSAQVTCSPEDNNVGMFIRVFLSVSLPDEEIWIFQMNSCIAVCGEISMPQNMPGAGP